MKTLATLPTIPEGWRWVQDPVTGVWDEAGPNLLQELTQTKAQLGEPPPIVGTPPAGSTVWDPQSLDWARYQPETP